MSRSQKIPLSSLILDEGTVKSVMGRLKIDEDTVASYRETYRENPEAMPPITVFAEGGKFIIGGGYHRAFGAMSVMDKDKKPLLHEINAIVLPGGRRDAILFSLLDNATHGLRRTNGDKRLCVERLLEDKEWSQWSNVQVAKQAGVVESFVRKVKGEAISRTVNEQKSKENAAKRLGITLADIPKQNNVTAPVKMIHKSGKITYMVPGKEKGTPEITIDRTILLMVLSKASVELKNVPNGTLAEFIAKVKADLTVVAKGKNPFPTIEEDAALEQAHG
ncbi:putative streptomycin biosynthesis operon possible regulatory [Caudoviricetes sp.]|nr:putative streptomycin biosynthesis operon possible regulatory [Caudoviricetes sp.]